MKLFTTCFKTDTGFTFYKMVMIKRKKANDRWKYTIKWDFIDSLSNVRNTATTFNTNDGYVEVIRNFVEQEVPNAIEWNIIAEITL